MLKTRFIVVDRTRSSFLKEGESFFLGRLQRYTHTKWMEVKPAKIKKGRPAEEILTEEGGSILKKIVRKDYIIALDRRGDVYDSEGLARRIERLSFNNDKLTFVIGGALGLSKEVLDRANEVFSLSRMTLTHEMVRLFLIEQLYRAFTIINNEKYHK